MPGKCKYFTKKVSLTLCQARINVPIFLKSNVAKKLQ